MIQTNEAAERQEPIACQRCGQGILPEDQPAHDEWDEALAAERRATVERIKKHLAKDSYRLDNRRYGQRILEQSEWEAILDAEAAR